MGPPHCIVFFVVEGFQPLDLFGPLDAFEAASQTGGADYRVDVAAFTCSPVASESGIQVVPTATIQETAQIDTLVMCGGRGARSGPLHSRQRKHLIAAFDRAKRVVSICTGAFLLARTGRADGRRLATHWRYALELEQRYPDIDVDSDALFLKDGKIWSSAGVTAGIDVSLALIAADHGRPTAAAVARHLVLYMHRTGNQAQYSDPLRAQDQSDGRFADLVEWISNHLDERLTIDRIAERAAMTPRHFSRLFRDRFGLTPGRYVENLRLDRARVLLGQGGARVAQVASAVGYASDVAFRRAFERRFEMSPTQYRDRFSSSLNGEMC